jgi:hypothetical protein
MDEEKLLQDVSNWLDTGGLVFEMEVARRIAESTFITTQGEHYIDPIHNNTLHVVQIFAECKGGTAPWIVFSGRSWENGAYDPVFYAQDDCSACVTISEDLGRLVRNIPSGYAIAEKRNKEKPGGQDHAYQAVQQVTNATLLPLHVVHSEVGGATYVTRTAVQVFAGTLAVSIPLVIIVTTIMITVFRSQKIKEMLL